MLSQEELRKLAREKIKEASKSEDKAIREMATEILKREGQAYDRRTST